MNVWCLSLVLLFFLSLCFDVQHNMFILCTGAYRRNTEELLCKRNTVLLDSFAAVWTSHKYFKDSYCKDSLTNAYTRFSYYSGSFQYKHADWEWKQSLKCGEDQRVARALKSLFRVPCLCCQLTGCTWGAPDVQMLWLAQDMRITTDWLQLFCYWNMNRLESLIFVKAAARSEIMYLKSILKPTASKWSN